MNLDQRALGNGTTVGHNNDSPTYGIHNRTVGSSASKRSEVSRCEKNNPPSSMMVVDGIDEGSKSSDDLENEYDEIQNLETTGSDNVGDDDALKNQDDTLTLRFTEKVIKILQEKNIRIGIRLHYTII